MIHSMPNLPQTGDQTWTDMSKDDLLLAIATAEAEGMAGMRNYLVNLLRVLEGKEVQPLKDLHLKRVEDERSGKYVYVPVYGT